MPRLVALLVLLLVAGCAPEEAPPPEPPSARPSDEPGPYPVGATTLRHLSDRGVLLTIEVWYPAAPEPGAELQPYEELPVVAASYRDAEPDLRGAPYPLVAFSHGYGGIRYQSSYLATWLASHGFVVTAVDHPGNTLLDLDEDATTDVAIQRPADVAEAVDVTLREFPHRIDGDRGYAMVGHSFGAWTTLVIGGGRLDREHLVAWCADHDSRGCRFLGGDDLAGIDDLSPASPDPRARVAVALAPGLAYAFGPGGEGLADNVPTLVQGGDLDGDMPYEDEIRPVWEALPDDGALATLHGGAHFGFSDLCRFFPLEECDGAEAGYMEPERMQELSRVLTLAWIRARWLGEADEERFLSADWLAAAGDADWEE